MNNNINFSSNFFYSIESQKYYLIKDNNVFKIIVEKRKNEILIKTRNYEIILNIDNFCILTKNLLHSIDKAYEFIINIFEENKAIIKDIIPNKNVKLLLNMDIEIVLVYNKENKNKNKAIDKSNIKYYELDIKYTELKKEIYNLKNEIRLLKKEKDKFQSNQDKDKDKCIEKNKDDQNQDKKESVEVDKIINIDNDTNQIKKIEEIKENFNPSKIKFSKDIIKNSFNFNSFNNSFTVFESINNLLYIIYSNKNKSIISYNLIENKKTIEIKNAHNKDLSNFRHYLDKNNKRDLIISVSAEDNNIKLWNFNNFECLYDYKNVNKSGYLYSACFLNDNHNNYIITSNCVWKGISEPIKIYDFNGTIIKEIKNSKDKTYFIDTYYDIKSNKNYIISGNEGQVKSYNYNNASIFHRYYDGDKADHDNAVISNYNNEIKLIESSDDGNIRIWNFFSGKLLKKIKVCNDDLYGIYLWNKDFLFVGCGENFIKIIDLEKMKIVNIIFFLITLCFNNLIYNRIIFIKYNYIIKFIYSIY